MVNFSSDDLVGLEFDKLIAPEEQSKVNKYYKNRISEKAAPDIYETKMVNKKGASIDVEINASLIKYENKPASLAFIRDISERKKGDAALKVAERASRLASLGTLSAGIAHEINQPLTAIRIQTDGMMYLLNKEYNVKKEKFYDTLKDISGQSARIENIIRHMRSLIQVDKDLKPVRLNINDLVKKALSLIDKQLIKHNIKTEFDLETSIQDINSHPASIEQVILNIVTNSLQALKEKDYKDKRIIIKTYDRKRNCCIIVSDNGPGLPVGDPDRIFEPFFSTKKSGDNLGLGLSIVQNMLSSLGGVITVRNNEAGGAAFEICLPKSI